MTLFGNSLERLQDNGRYDITAILNFVNFSTSIANTFMWLSFLSNMKCEVILSTVHSSGVVNNKKH